MKTLNCMFCMALIILAISIEPHEATRIFGAEEDCIMVRKVHLFVQSLQSRKVNPPAPSGCSFIGGNGGTPCAASTISEKNFAGRVVAVAAPPPPPPPSSNAYPQQMVQSGVATNRKLL